jgi:HTH-type transcriptional regulator, competence development regulator
MSKKFGDKIRQLREENELLLRQVAPLLEIDSPQLSKIERGERPAKKEQIQIFANIYKVQNDELLTLWLADQVHEVLAGEPMADNALKSVSKTIKKKK